MKTLILSIPTGNGHHAAGEALKEALENRGGKVVMMDAFKYISPRMTKIVERGYYLAVDTLPGILSTGVYNLANRKTQPSKRFAPAGILNAALASKLRSFVETYNPDTIVCTHVMSAMLTQTIKEKRWTSAQTCAIITDWTVHPYWQDASFLDWFVIPSELLEYQMRKKGIAAEKLLPFGIPVRPEFAEKIDRGEARRHLKIDENKKTVLLMSGSLGNGRLSKTLSSICELDLPFQVLAVCGKNAKALRRIKKTQYAKPVYAFGYINNVDLLMDAADICITKPGGMTTSEALAKELPLIMVDPIAGHEERNAEFFLNNGLGLAASKTFPIAEALYSVFQNDRRLEHYRKIIHLYSKKNSADVLAEFLLSHSASVPAKK